MGQDTLTAEPFFKKYYPFWDKLTEQEQWNIFSCSSMQSYRKSDFI